MQKTPFEEFLKSKDNAEKLALFYINEDKPKTGRQRYILDTCAHALQPGTPYFKFGNEFAQELIKANYNGDIHLLLKESSLYKPEKELHPVVFSFLDYWIFICFRILSEPYLTPSDKVALGLISVFTIHKKTGTTSYFSIPIGEDYAEIDKSKYLSGSDDDWLFYAILNGLAYVCSGKPDLREYRAPHKDDKSISRREKDRQIQQYGSEDCILVSWGWKKERIYHEGAWYTEGHFWWKPCGKGRVRRELDWRVGHQRQRRKGVIECEEMLESDAS